MAPFHFIKIMRKRLILISEIVLLSGGCLLNAQSFSCGKWQVLDIPFQANRITGDPLAVHFGAIITHEGGKAMKVPGFYNEDNTWIIRFCPPQEGTWSYTTYSSLTDLSGNQGIVSVKPATGEDEHGPISICSNDPQKFIYDDGTPCFLMAFEMDWLFALDHDNASGIPRTREITSHLVENGFNQVVMNVYAYDASWGDRASIRPEHNFAEPGVFPFGGSNNDPDHSELNMGFFKHLDRVIAHLDEQGIIAHLMIYVWNKKVNWPEPGSPEDNTYFDYVVKRYQAFPNLIWDISKEALQYGRNDLGYITERIERLRELDAHKRLLSVHDYGYCAVYPDKVDFISIQEWKPNIYDAMRRVMKKHADKPVFNIEHGGYEKSMHSIFDGSYNDPLVCLDRNYQIVFAGAYSTYYWQNSSWYEVVYNPSELSEGNQPRFVYYRHLAGLFEKYDFHYLQPLQSTFTSYGLSDHQSVYMFYCTRGMIAMQGDVPELKGKTFLIKWFDPLSGVYQEAGKISFKNSTWLNISKPDTLKAPFAVAILEIVQ